MSELYSTIVVWSRLHVICESKERKGNLHRDANYMGTGKALCGVLKKGQTLEEWMKNKS